MTSTNFFQNYFADTEEANASTSNPFVRSKHRMSSNFSTIVKESCCFFGSLPVFSACIKRTLTHMFAVACVMKRTLSRMPIITSILSWTVTLCEREASLLVLFPEGVFLVGFPFSQRIPSWRAGRSRTLYFSHGSSLLLLIVFQSTLISSRALTFCCPLNAISTVFLWTCHWQCQRQAFQVVFHVNRNASHDFSVPSIGGPPSFEVWCRLGIHLSEQYLACTETAMASASIPVKFLTDCSWLTHGNWLWLQEQLFHVVAEDRIDCCSGS